MCVKDPGFRPTGSWTTLSVETRKLVTSTTHGVSVSWFRFLRDGLNKISRIDVLSEKNTSDEVF